MLCILVNVSVKLLPINHKSSMRDFQRMTFVCDHVGKDMKQRVNFFPQQEQDKHVTWDGITNKD